MSRFYCHLSLYLGTLFVLLAGLHIAAVATSERAARPAAVPTPQERAVREPEVMPRRPYQGLV